MQFQKAEQCPAATQKCIRTPTFPPVRTAPAAWKSAAGFFGALAFVVMSVGAAAGGPVTLSQALAGVCAKASLAATWWVSILLTSMPYVTAGTMASAIAQRVCGRSSMLIPFAVMLSPGCDCGLAGFAFALRSTPPAIAGFALTWSAAAGPVALIATHAVLGDRVLAARVVGAFVASAVTAALWAMARDRDIGHRCAVIETPFIDRLLSSILGLAACAAGATIVLLVAAPNVLSALRSPVAAAVVGALLSPCSTADAVLARVLVQDHAGQAAFLIAAQCIDVRQMAMLARTFGSRRALLSAIAGCAGCAAAAFIAR